LDIPLVVMRGDRNRLDKGRLLLERAVWPMRVVEATYSRSTRSRCVRETIRIRSRHSRRTLPTQRSACAFARGAAIGARMTLIPSERKISSKPAVNLLSRSRISNPGAVRVSGHAGQMHATMLEFDEEEHVQASQPERLDREEVTLKDPGRLLAQELPPAHARGSRCGLDGARAEAGAVGPARRP
jgi:hypothetical protein